MQRRKSKAQSFAEYALLIAIAVGVLMAMRIYVVRGVQEKYRQSADIFGQGEQYERGVTAVTNLDGTPTVLPPPPPPTGDCSFVVNRVAELEEQVKDLKERAEAWDKSAADTEAQLPALKAKAEALTTEANQKEAQANNLRAQAAAKTAEADAKQAQIDQYKKDYPNCFVGYHYCDEYYCDPCVGIVAEVDKLGVEISDLRSQAESLNNEAIRLDGEVRDLRSQAESLNNSIAQFETHIQKLREQAKGFREEADDKGAQITQYRDDYPKCFATP